MAKLINRFSPSKKCSDTEVIQIVANQNEPIYNIFFYNQTFLLEHKKSNIAWTIL